MMEHKKVRGQGNATPSMASSLRKNSRTQKAKKGIFEFFGLDEDENNLQRWDRRRLTMAGSIGRGLKDNYMMTPDQVDSVPNIVDPLRTTNRQLSRMSSGTAGSMSIPGLRKKSVFQMTMGGLGSIAAARKELRKKSVLQGLSFPQGSLHVLEEKRHVEDAFSLEDDVFYDEHPSKSVSGQVLNLNDGPSAPGWRRSPPQALPSTPAADQTDGPHLGLSRIKQKVIDNVTNREKRQVGIGLLGNVMNRRLKSTFLNKDIKEQIDNLDDHRPYFTYWVTFVQIVIFIVAVSVYGFAPIGISTKIEYKDVKMSNLAIQTESHVEKENMWIGPRQADLIHLGAKYSPCMRVDKNLNEAIALDKKEEKESGCCIRNDGGGCRQTIEAGCSDILSRWEKWGPSNHGPKGRTSGAVCGQDPEFCSKPASTPLFKWADDITKWPHCEDTVKVNQTSASTDNAHMSCEILGRPCCFGIQGECIITTREHCDLKRGFFHSHTTLCSQVNCFEEICGMIPFAYMEYPDQFYRLWTSLFLHGGVFHLFITILFQMFIMKDIEKLMGAIRITIIYIGSGVAGNLASCTFIPYQVETGPSGAQFGIMACLLVEVLQSFQMYRRPALAIMKLLVPVFFMFVFGLLPWFDNFAHMFGFIFGFLLAFSLIPYVSFGKFDRRRKIITILVCLGGAISVFTILVLIFYVAPLWDCHWCVYLNCIPFTADFCENMQVNLKKNATYSKFN